MTFSSTVASVALSPHSVPVFLPSLSNNVLSISRGGAISAAVTSILNTESQHAIQQDMDDSSFFTDTSSSIDELSMFRGGAGNSITPQGSAVLSMAIAMSLHYLAYNLARPSTIALFTSAKTGFKGNNAAFPLAMAFISPSSLLLLLLYGKILGTSGPRTALRRTTYLCCMTLNLSALLVYTLSQRVTPLTIEVFGLSIPLMQALVGALFIFRESYVQLLTSQYWSFMASVLSPDQGAKWFSQISGLTSVTSALAGMLVAPLVERLDLPGVLAVAGTVLSFSLIFTERAYTISDVHGFNPGDEVNKKASKPEKKTMRKKKKVTEVAEEEDHRLTQKAAKLFGRVPILKALFIEILAGQGLATLLNVCFVTKLSQSIPVDVERAGWMGRFFALINVISCTLQFGIIPRIMPYLEAKALWRFMPVVMVVATTNLSLNKDTSLNLISGSFMLWKIMEFSFRRMLDEMIYVPLDYESRFLGKEIISVFGYRFGKSGMSLALSGLTKVFGNFGLQQLSMLTAGSSVVWLTAAWNVSNLVPTRAEATEAYNKGNS